MLQFQKCASILFYKNNKFQGFVDFDQFLSGDTCFFVIKRRPNVDGKKYNKKLCVFDKQFLNWSGFP